MIDYLDIVSVSRLMIPNEEAADHPEKFVRTNYKFNYLIQIEVSAINGLSAIDKITKQSEYVQEDEENKESFDNETGATVDSEDRSIIKRSCMSLANIFFKLQNEDTSIYRHLLVNKEQSQVMDLVIEKLE